MELAFSESSAIGMVEWRRGDDEVASDELGGAELSLNSFSSVAFRLRRSSESER